MAYSPASSPLPRPSGKKYDVFLNFRGEDVRNGFLSYLHGALLQKGIDTYVDERIERGDVISEALFKAIDESLISVTIFSEKYASSWWCLEELARIIECNESNGQIVIPVFYHVKTSVVRNQLKTYARAFAEHEKSYKEDKLDKWRSALRKAGLKAGWSVTKTKKESELVEIIVNDIVEKFDSRRLNDDCKGLVGIDKRIKDIEPLLLNNSSLDVQVVGIWGGDGMGKTTLAQNVFKRFQSQFDRSCILENISEEWKIYGSDYLKSKFVSQLHTGKTILKDRTCHERLLIVLDDVEDTDHFELFVGNDCKTLCPRSVVVITTNNKKVLENIGVDIAMYNLKELSYEEALQLFLLNAFRKRVLPESFMKLSGKMVNYAKRVPLALKVLGSFLHSKGEEEWKSVSDKLKVHSNRILDLNTQNILEISFNGLDDKKKAIFLDIACFFKGIRKDEVEDILEDIDCFERVITDLIDKSLITIKGENELWMHDLIQKMSQKIAGKQYSRLWMWVADDICRVLRTNSGTETIEGMVLDADEIREDINLKPAVFEKMKDMRLLKFSLRGGFQLQLLQGLHFLSDKLVYLEWDTYPFSSLPSSFTPYNLVKLQMCSSQLKQLWNGLMHLEKLKNINLQYSKNLTSMPDLSQANLKILNLKGCTSLVKLLQLKFQEVVTTKKSLVRFSDVFHVRNWHTNKGFEYWDTYANVFKHFLDLQGCSNLKTIPMMSGNIQHIHLGSTAVEELHSSICSLPNLISIHLNNCKRLKSLPSNIVDLKSLEYLDLGGCLSFHDLPNELPNSLIELNLSGTAIEKVDESSFECLIHLKFLIMNNCRSLGTLPSSICKLKSLERLSLSSCSKLKSFPEILEPMKCLQVVNLKGIKIKELPSSNIGKSELLRLFLAGCRNFSSVPTGCNMCRGICLHDKYQFGGLFKFQISESLPYVLVDEIEVDLTYSNILRIPDWYNNHASIIPDQSIGSDTATVAFKVSEFGVPEFKICKCKNIGRCRGSFCYLVNYYSSAADDGYVNFMYTSSTQISCCLECSNFDQVRKSLMNEFQIKISGIEVVSTTEQKELDRRTRSIFCCQGDEVPQWFSYQSTESSIDVGFSPRWHNTHFLCFALCVVFKFENSGSNYDHNNKMRCCCEYHFKTTSRESRKFHWSFMWNHSDFEKDMSSILDGSNHMFVHFLHDEDYRNYKDATLASFKFYLESVDGETRGTVGNYKLEKCGIRPLYLQDAKELIRRRIRQEQDHVTGCISFLRSFMNELGRKANCFK
ncbi:TIR-NBS-LRR-like protein [Trema orientale]|uniref:ADP-ribosyl cyclase/cyclic ADP-ribose hydrolase n=1 Tax=Trema orientale TaxID=63057 RepID=A0A2P5BB73_TREOI|nr:TIR-NBS-LRR-like protein [Trema orientale]